MFLQLQEAQLALEVDEEGDKFDFSKRCMRSSSCEVKLDRLN
jgi:hypothetical protein